MTAVEYGFGSHYSQAFQERKEIVPYRWVQREAEIAVQDKQYMSDSGSIRSGDYPF